MTTEHGLCQVSKTFCFNVLSAARSALCYESVVIARQPLCATPQLPVSAGLLLSPEADLFHLFRAVQKKRPVHEAPALASTTTLSRAVDAELHRRLARLVGAHIRRGHVVVEVRD